MKLEPCTLYGNVYHDNELLAILIILESINLHVIARHVPGDLPLDPITNTRDTDLQGSSTNAAAENVTATPVNFTSSPPALPADQDITEYKLVVLVTGGIVSERPSENQALDAALSVNIDPEKMLNGSRKRKPSRKGPKFQRELGRSIEELGEETIQGVDNLGMEPVSEMTEMSAKPGNHDEDTRSLSAVKVEICEPNGESVKQGSDGDSGVSSTGSGRAADKDSRRVLGWIESYL
ncbi:hypothetical protein Bbelb_382700 [Branchiostoma belcheri]|nr:hypothetical protein Bbelb_382700 [Branchiostoma belcheri]